MIKLDAENHSMILTLESLTSFLGLNQTYKTQKYNLEDDNDLKLYLQPHVDTLNESEYLFKIKTENC